MRWLTVLEMSGSLGGTGLVIRANAITAHTPRNSTS